MKYKINIGIKKILKIQVQLLIILFHHPKKYPYLKSILYQYTLAFLVSIFPKLKFPPFLYINLS